MCTRRLFVVDWDDGAFSHVEAEDADNAKSLAVLHMLTGRFGSTDAALAKMRAGYEPQHYPVRATPTH